MTPLEIKRTLTTAANFIRAVGEPKFADDCHHAAFFVQKMDDANAELLAALELLTKSAHKHLDDCTPNRAKALKAARAAIAKARGQ
jgi:hypothetical protein